MAMLNIPVIDSSIDSHTVDSQGDLGPNFNLVTPSGTTSGGKGWSEMMDPDRPDTFTLSPTLDGESAKNFINQRRTAAQSVNRSGSSFFDDPGIDDSGNYANGSANRNVANGASINADNTDTVNNRSIVSHRTPPLGRSDSANTERSSLGQTQHSDSFALSDSVDGSLSGGLDRLSIDVGGQSFLAGRGPAQSVDDLLRAHPANAQFRPVTPGDIDFSIEDNVNDLKINLSK